jgi:fructoselysine-6-phosphate deglycase
MQGMAMGNKLMLKEKVYMRKFDEKTYLSVGKNTVALKDKVEQIVDEVCSRGYQNIFLIGSGGSYAMMIPFEYYLKSYSTIPVYLEVAADLVLTGHNQLGKQSVAIFTSSSGTTKETVVAAAYCREHGATTIGISGVSGAPLAVDVTYPIINKMDDFSASDADYILLYMLIFRFMYRHNDFPEYEDFMADLSKLPKALVSVKTQCDAKAESFADKYKNEPYHMVIGQGTVWGEAYSYAMCVMEEMQWIRTKSVRAAEFFHGSLEIVEKGVSVILLKGEDATRPLAERVERFATKYTDKLTVFDTKEYRLPGINDRFRYLLSPIIITAVLDRVSIHLEAKRNHSLDIRRYYRVIEY